MTRFDEIMVQARAGLVGMIRRKNPAGIAGLRSVIAALENSCAVPAVPENLAVTSDSIAGAVQFGESEAQRRTLTDEEVDQILDEEIDMRHQQAESLDRVHRDLEASIARYQATLITRLKDGDLGVY